MSWFLIGIALWVSLLGACWFLLDCSLAVPWRGEDVRGRPRPSPHRDAPAKMHGAVRPPAGKRSVKTKAKPPSTETR